MEGDKENLEYQKIEYHKYINKLVIIKNIINLICCTILAIFFKKAWLILLALLFTCSVSKEE